MQLIKEYLSPEKCLQKKSKHEPEQIITETTGESQTSTDESQTTKDESQATADESQATVDEPQMQSNLIQIARRHGCSPVNFLHIF